MQTLHVSSCPQNMVDFAKVCKVCKWRLPLDCFSTAGRSHDGLMHKCHSCLYGASLARRLSFEGFMAGKARNVRIHASKYHRCREHEDVGENYNRLLDRLLEQEGRCYHSGVVLQCLPLSNWECSLDYQTSDAIGREVLVALEFHTLSPWSRAKVVNLPRKLMMRSQHEDGPSGRERLLERSGMLRKGAQASARRRRRKGRLEAGVCSITNDEIVELFHSQAGRCAISGFPLSLQRGGWEKKCLEVFVLMLAKEH